MALIAAPVLGLSSCGFLGIGPWHGKALDDTRDGFQTYDGDEGSLSIDDLVRASRSNQAPGGRLDALVIGSVAGVDPGRPVRQGGVRHQL